MCAPRGSSCASPLEQTEKTTCFHWSPFVVANSIFGPATEYSDMDQITKKRIQKSQKEHRKQRKKQQVDGVKLQRKLCKV